MRKNLHINSNSQYKILAVDDEIGIEMVGGNSHQEHRDTG